MVNGTFVSLIADNAVNWLPWACFLSHTAKECEQPSLSCAMYGLQSGLTYEPIYSIHLYK